MCGIEHGIAFLCLQVFLSKFFALLLQFFDGANILIVLIKIIQLLGNCVPYRFNVSEFVLFQILIYLVLNQESSA